MGWEGDDRLKMVQRPIEKEAVFSHFLIPMPCFLLITVEYNS